VSEIRLVDRDYRIIREIDRWRAVQGKHIKELAGFDGQKACDRRLRKLIEAEYIKREKILYGVAGIYSNTSKAKYIAEITTNQKIRVEQIHHDIIVIDTAIYIHKQYDVAYSDMATEIELHRQDGFGERKHRPDFICTIDGETICVEVELSLKAKDRLEKNIVDNFRAYDRQIWVVPSMNTKIADILNQNLSTYTNIEILELQEVQKTYG